MNFFERWKYKFAQRRFNREYRNYRRTGSKLYNLADARSVGILYSADNEETFSIVKKYVRYLKEEEGIKKIMAVGYYEEKGKEKEKPAFISPKLEFDFITRKENCKNIKPTGNTVKNFTIEEYDILLDLTFDKKLPLQYMLNQSKSRFKVGVHNESLEQFYDLMIITKENRSMTELIDNINMILSKLNKKNNE